MTATYTYAARDAMPPVTLTLHQGESRPETWRDGRIPQWGNGCLFIGDKGMLLSDYSKHVLLPEKDFADFVRPAETIAKSPGHYAEWITAAKTGKPDDLRLSVFGLAHRSQPPGQRRLRTGKKLEWNAAAMKATNAPEADQFLRREYRKGWDRILKS